MNVLSDCSVVVVGNGSSLLGSGLGNVIDAHDEVVRFNRFEIGSFAADVGQRTTIWFCNRDLNHPSLTRVLREQPLNEIHVHTWADTTAAAASFRDALAAMGKTAEVIEVELDQVREMEAFLGTGYRFFSTGAIGAWTLLKRFREVSLVGFDWWRIPDRMHYFNDGQGPPNQLSGHRPTEEKIFFEHLVKAGRVRFLDNRSLFP